MQELLTAVMIQTVNKHIKADSFGISIVNLPDFDYRIFAEGIQKGKKIEIYFLGYKDENKKSLTEKLPVIEGVEYYYTVEEAEISRNSGNEAIFRIHIVKNQELEKISSLKWYDSINMDLIYIECCKYTKERLSKDNITVKLLLDALKYRDIRRILNFERVLNYLEALLKSKEEDLPETICKEIYLLGLLADSGFASGRVTREDIRRQIKQNYMLVRRISGLEKNERKNITNYAANGDNKLLTRRILEFYSTKAVDLLKDMEVSDVEACLKSVSRLSRGTKGKNVKREKVNSTIAAAQLIFNNDVDEIGDLLETVKEDIDNRPYPDKAYAKEFDVAGMKMKVQAEPTTESIARRIDEKNNFGGVIYAEVLNPKDALDDIAKCKFDPFDEEYLKPIREYFQNIKTYIHDEQLSQAFERFLEERQNVIQYSKRLQDIPLLQIVEKKNEFIQYLRAYEIMLEAIRSNFSRYCEQDSIGAKDIVNTILSLDFFFIVGENNFHAIPTPLNPLYLWKYIKLAEEMLDVKDLDEGQDCSLSEEDKSFIIRKAMDIPDPLTLVLLPNSIIGNSSECLPIAGKIGNLPIYSTKPQIDEGDMGMEEVKQGIIRYMCLYPHASMMLRIAFINPPLVEAVAGMLKRLDRDKEFSAYGSVGIDLSIYRTREASYDWIEIQDKSLSEGLLGKVRGRYNGKFNMTVANKILTYPEILNTVKREQHIIVIFDPNEKQIDTARNNRQIHIHPLCVPKVYEYNKIRGSVRIRPANEGGLFADYSNIIEQLCDLPSSFRHKSIFVNSPLQQDTYKTLLEKTDWLILLDQNLKSWDISLRSTSEKLYYKNTDYRSIGIYSNNKNKFILGYNQLISSLGNYVANDKGLTNVIEAIREVNDDGLLSIASHTTNNIFDQNHGKGSLGLAIAAIKYKQLNPEAILVGLDTQLAREWLADREDGRLPDLIGIKYDTVDVVPQIDVIEVKTYAAYKIMDNHISGEAVDQVMALEELINEIFGKSEKITTVSRREVLREQIFDCLFHSDYSSDQKYELSNWLNNLFAGEYGFRTTKTICFVNFDVSDSKQEQFTGLGDNAHQSFELLTIGGREIQAIITASTNVKPRVEVVSLTDSMDIVATEESFKTEEQSQSEQSANISVEQQAVVDVVKPVPASVEDEMVKDDMEDIKEKCIRLNLVFKNYGIKAFPVSEDLVQRTARFTRFKIELRPGETLKRLVDRRQDIARELEAYGEVFIDNIKGTRYVGMDVPFENNNKPLLLLEHLNELVNDEESLNVLSGQTPDGLYKNINLAKAPHMLIAGTTGSGKTVFLYSILVSLLSQFSEEELELLIIDPKQTDFHFFSNIPYLREGGVLTDADEAIEALRRINTVDKEIRTKIIKEADSRDIDSYNKKNPQKPMKRLVIVIDEYADLIQAAELKGREVKKEFEINLCMLAQRVRNLGIHLVIATQQPKATIVTSSLKAVLPFRVSFRLPSHVDSQTILDRSGAEDLLGKGDMLMLTDSELIRMQGFYISEDELKEFLRKLRG